LETSKSVRNVTDMDLPAENWKRKTTQELLQGGGGTRRVNEGDETELNGGRFNPRGVGSGERRGFKTGPRSQSVGEGDQQTEEVPREQKGVRDRPAFGGENLWGGEHTFGRRYWELKRQSRPAI